MVATPLRMLFLTSAQGLIASWLSVLVQRRIRMVLCAVTSVSLGDQVLTEVFDFTVGSSSAYHNLHWLGYLLESEIAARSGSGLTITYANAPSNPFDEPKVHYACYEHVRPDNAYSGFG